MIGDITKDKVVSGYESSQDIKNLTLNVKRDYEKGSELLNKPLVELNYRSVLEDMNRGQRTFNAFVDESLEDPSQAWKWRGRS